MIKSHGWFYKLPFKLTLTYSVIASILLICVFLLLTQNNQQNSFDEFYKQRDIVNEVLLTTASRELSIDEKKRTYQSLNDSSLLHKFQYLILTDDTGKVLYSYNFTFADSQNYTSVTAPASLSFINTIYSFINPIKNSQLIKDYTPVLQRDFIIGKLYMGIPINNLREKISTYNRNIALGASLIFCLGIILVFTISYIFARPLNELLTASQNLSLGHFASRAAYYRDNQIGDLAKNINKIGETLENLYSQNESLNRQLKVIFRDKLGELNFEINQRRMAEFSLKEKRRTISSDV